MKSESRSLHTVDQGQGEPVLLLHSGGMSSRQWRKLIDLLAPRHRVIAPDFLGAGANPPWPRGEPFHYRDDVAAVLEVMDRVAEPAHLVGHSYGGLIALTLARQHPGRVRSLALYDPVAFGVLHGAHDEVGLADLAGSAPALSPHDPATGGTEPWLEAFVDYWNGPGSWQAMPAPSRTAFLAVGHKVFLEVDSLLRDRTPVEAYSGIAAKTLLLSGERTPVAARRVAELLVRALPNGSRREIRGAGHMGPITHGAEVNEVIAEHIARAQGAGGGEPRR